MTLPSSSEPLTIAHRGASSLAPENTIAAARKALELGAEMWELDVALTAEGQLIVIHDDTLTRTSNVAAHFPDRWPWPVHGFTLAQIRRLDFGSWFIDRDPFGQIAAGHVSPPDLASYIGLPAPTLSEALAFTRDSDWRVNVEIKDLSGTPGDTTVVAQVVALIERLAMPDRVLISSFNHGYIGRVKAANPGLATGLLVENPVDDPAALLRRFGAQAYHPHAAAIPPGTIADLRAQGFDVNIWTVNDEAAMQHLIEAGASGLFTDFPQRLKTLLAATNAPW
jgi:glycerophosphoryl diester phosphodiesterase